MELIYREELRKRFAEECVGECSCCKYSGRDPDEAFNCALIDEAPNADAVSRAQYDDLYNKYTALAYEFNEKVREIIRRLDRLK